MKHPIIPFVLLFCSVAAALTPVTVHAATTLTLRPDSTTSTNGDSFVTTGPSNNLTGNNYGAAGALGVTAGLAKGSFASVIRFDVSTLTSGFDAAYGAGMWTIDSILLELTSATPNNAIFNSPNATGLFSVNWFSNDGWTEGSGTPSSSSTSGIVWNDMAGLTSGAQSLGTFAYDTSGTDQYMLTPSAGLLTDLYGGNQASLWLAAADSQISALFNSRNNGVASNRPALIITASAVPEPGRILLIAMGMLSLLNRRRKSKGGEV